METVSRRHFFEIASESAALGLMTTEAQATTKRPRRATAANQTIHLSGDGLELSPPEYVTLLSDLCQKAAVEADAYCLGGEVERFEKQCAALLGKETAVFMPTGTLANQLAIRALAKDRRRVLLPEMSHIYNDTGDACQILSGLNLIPMAPGKATFTREEVERVMERTASGRVASQVGVIVAESPVRRLSGELFDFNEM